jgi:7-keto-8-aminopelargonate synthetase-like enzyme
MIISDSIISNYITVNNKSYSYFGGNNYLGLTGNPELANEAIEAIKRYGTNYSASRQTTGTSKLHLELEKSISEFKDKSDSVVFASGYFGNRILMQTLRDRYSAVFLDKSAHPSILDGIPGDIKNVYFYNHCNPEHLDILLKENRKFKPLIITDGIFALTGEISPLDRICQLAEKSDAIIIIDDAHATGVIGENGRGTPDFFHLDKAPYIYQSETMSKAFGAYGGFISAGRDLTDKIRNGSGMYQGSTALPPPVVAAACRSVSIIRQQPQLRTTLFENQKLIRDGISGMEFQTIHSCTPIIPLLFDNQNTAKALSEYLMKHDIIVPFVTYPVKIKKFLLRIAVSAIHTREQIDELLNVLNKWRTSHGVNKD